MKNSGELVYELHGHNSFVYGLARLPNGNLVSSGEDRTVRIWKGNAEFQCLIQPCVSVWAVAAAPSGDIFAAGSDGFVRVFTQSPDRVASADELQVLYLLMYRRTKNRFLQVPFLQIKLAISKRMICQGQRRWINLETKKDR